MDRKDTYTINLLSLKEGLNEFDYKIRRWIFRFVKIRFGAWLRNVDVHLDLTRRE